MREKAFLDLSEIRALIKLKKYDEAEKLLHELKTVHPDDEYLGGALFDIYLKNSLFDKAKEILDNLLKSSPDNFFLLSRKGDLLSAVNKKKEALELFHNLYNTNNDPHIGWRLANEYYRSKTYHKAEYYFDRTITKIFDKPELHFLGFKIKKALNKYEAARDLLESAIDYSDNSQYYLSQKMKFQAELKGISGQEWEKSLKYSKSKEDPLVIKQLAEKFLHEKNFEKAEEYYQNVLKSDNNLFNKSRLGYVYYKWGKYDLALTIFLEMPVKNFLVPSFIAMVIKSAKKTNQEEKVIEHLHGLLEKHPHAKQLWGAIKILSG